MTAALPEEPVLDMLSFALSGPGILTASLFTISGLAFLTAFFEIGPRRQPRSPSVYFLRAHLSHPARVELPDGSVRLLPAGEAVMRFSSREGCTSVARMLPDGSWYEVYLVEGGVMKVVGRVKGGSVDAPGVVGWPRGVVGMEDEGEVGARWEEYLRVGEDGTVEKEWAEVMRGLGGVEVVNGGDCKLCGGSGHVRCHRCGGVSSRNGARGAFQCDCRDGLRPCEWCKGEGL